MYALQYSPVKRLDRSSSDNDASVPLLRALPRAPGSPIRELQLTGKPLHYPPLERGRAISLETPRYDYQAATGLRFQPPRDVLTRALALSRDMKLQVGRGQDEHERGKQLWLAHDLSDRSDVIDYYKKLWTLEYSTPDAQFDDFTGDARDTSLAREFVNHYASFRSSYSPLQATDVEHWKKLNDNVYGRKFESEVARRLVENPLQEMLNAARTMGEALLNDVNKKLYADEFMDYEPDFLKELGELLRSDSRPWFGRTRHLDALANAPTMELLTKALTSIRDGFEMISVPYLIIKIGTALQFVDDQVTPEWRSIASYTYRGNILNERSTLEARPETTTRSSGYGLRLPHHPPYESAGELGEGTLWTTAKALRPEGLRRFAAQAMYGGYPVVCGLSGSTYHASIFMHYLRNRDKDFATGPAMLCVLAFLTFDGGHSFNEAMSVYQASVKLPSGPLNDDSEGAPWPEWRSHLAGYKFRYHQLTTLPSSDKGKKAVETVLQASLDNTLDFYSNYDTSQSQNQAAIAKMKAGNYQLPKQLVVALDSDEDEF